MDDQDWGDAAVGIEPGADTEVEDEGQDHGNGVPSILASIFAGPVPPVQVQVQPLTTVDGGGHNVVSVPLVL